MNTYGNRFALANRLKHKLHTIISQLHHITAAKHFSATATTIISQLHHIPTAKHFTTAKLSYHNYTILVPQNILQRQLHFSCTLYSIKNL